MKLFFEDRIMSWCDSFDIFDEIGRKLFRVNADPHGRKKLKIYDVYQRNKSVATIKECDEKVSGVEIKHGTRFVSVVRRFVSRLFRFFDLGFMGWCARGSFDDGNFLILDANDRTVAKISEGSNVDHCLMRCIDTLPEFTLHSLTFTLAIDVQVSESQCSDALAINS